MATIKDISRELNLGVSTVSMALNNNPLIAKETRERVLQKAKELKYVKNTAAVDLQKGKTNLILLIVNDPARTYFAEVINQMQRAVAKRGYDFLIATTFEGHDETAKRYIREHRADAVIIYTGTIDDDFIIENAADNFPIFVLGHDVIGSHVYSFLSTDERQGKEVIDYLTKLGHRRIAFVKGSPYSLGTQRKYRGYLYGLCEYGITVDERIIFDAQGGSREDGYAITESILPHLSEIDAIVYSNDELAIGGMEYLKEHGIQVPQDISIIGANNSPMCDYVSPRLTSTYLHRDDEYSLDKIIETLVELLKGKDISEEVAALEADKGEWVVKERETVIPHINQ